MDILPQEIAHDILLRLPIKSLIICTSVCKAWRSIIRNQSFIQFHLTRTISFNKQNDIHLLLRHTVSGGSSSTFLHRIRVHDILEEVYFVHYDNQAFDLYSKIKFPVAPKKERHNEFLRVVGICNGLVCVADDHNFYGYHFIIWNPFIRKSLTLPRPDLRFETFGPYDATVGFGFDAVANDYKVVRVLTRYGDHPRDPCVAEVYSLATGSWSSLGVVAPRCELIGRETQAFLNGALHWPTVRWTQDDRSYLILTFDVSNELFREISMPEGVIWSFNLALRLSVSHDRKSIALFTLDKEYNKFCLDIWLMKEYGIKESWTKLVRLSPQGSVSDRFMPWGFCFRNNGEVLLMLRGARKDRFTYDISEHELVSLDLVSKQMYKLGISGYPYCSFDSYEESLLLLDKTEAASY